MQKLVAALVGLACLAGLGNLSDGTHEGMPSVPDTNLSMTAEEIVLYESDDYTVFTQAVEAVIEQNAEDIHSAAGDDRAREALADLQEAGASNDATMAQAVSPSQPSASAATISMAGQVIPYVGAHLASTAPATGAGLWNGSDSTTDGSWGYFIGHNPGPFSCMLSLGIGSRVAVTDSAGAARSYTIRTVFDVPNTATWEDIEGSVTGYGESIVLQTCIDGGSHYRIMVAS